MNELPPGWVEAALRDVAVAEYGKGLAHAGRVPEGNVPVYGSAGQVGLHDAALVHEPAVIVGRKGNAGAAYVSLGPCWPIDTTYYLRVPSGLDPKFLGLQIQHARLDRLDSSTAIPSLRRPDLEGVRTVLAPTAEQLRIVAAIEEQFSRLDAAEASLRRAGRSLQRLRSATLVAAISGWPYVTIGEIGQVFVGTTPSRRRPEYWGGAIRWVSSGEVAFCRVRDTQEAITEAGLGSSDRLHPPGTVLLAMIGEGKTRGQAAILDVPAAHNQNSAAIRLNPDVCIPEWLFYVLMGRYSETRRAGSGAQQPALNRTRVKTISVPLPPLDEQHRIVAEVERQLSILDATKAAIDRALERSKALRRAILERAFTGRLAPQDPSDEPASVLLERIRAERAVAAPPRRAPSRRRATMAAQPSLPDVVGEPDAN